MKENGNLEDLSTDGRKILRWIGLQVGLTQKPEGNDNLEDLSIDVTKILRWIRSQGGLIQNPEGKWPLIRPKKRCEEYTKMNRVGWLKNLKENDNLEDPRRDAREIFNCMLQR